jgi:hypothetical protein
MRRTDLEHIIRAAGSITQDDEIIIIGSQAILGQYPLAPEALSRSMEAAIYPKNKRHLADLVDGSIGELSPCSRWKNQLKTAFSKSSANKESWPSFRPRRPGFQF